MTRNATLLLACWGLLDATPACADEERYAIHGQATYVEQEDNAFSAPYAGANSLTPSQGRETGDITLYLGVRPWNGAELWVTPELDQGFGLNDTLGIAGFPSGEAYKVGRKKPYLRLPRAFIRETLDTGGDVTTVASTANQLAGSHSADRWVFTVGKFGVTDIFDTNQYAHDPRNDFMNWSAVDAGSFDYAADAWGFTVGATAERYLGQWTWRAGVFDLSNIPNSEHLEPGFHEFQLIGEVERRYALFGQTGRILLTGFESRGRMGLLDHAIALGEATGTVPDVAAVRQYRGRPGASLTWEQPLSDSAGLFARLGKATGNVEAYEFTEIDRSVEVGGALRGTAWSRPNDTLGLAAIDNGISGARERYLALGGLGILIGDGRLPHAGPEEILESYYSWAVTGWAAISLDYQYVRNPGYNTDRGPVSLFAVRLHAQF
jgi:high affinity Mn2+ porin